MFFRVAVKLIVMDAVDGRRVHCLGAGKALTFPEGSCEEEGRQPLELRRRQRREKRDATKETRAQKGLSHTWGSSECGPMSSGQRACSLAPRGGGVMIIRLFL